jgi:hypothetical protein
MRIVFKILGLLVWLGLASVTSTSERWVTLSQALAERPFLRRRTLQLWTSERRIGSARAGRLLLVDLDEIDRMIAATKVAAAKRQ